MNQEYTVNRNLENALTVYRFMRNDDELDLILLGECWEGNPVFTLMTPEGGISCLNNGTSGPCFPLYSSREKAEAFLRTKRGGNACEVRSVDLENMLRIAATQAHFGIVLDAGPFNTVVLDAERTARLYETCMLYTGDVPSAETALYYRATQEAQGNWERIAKADSIGCYHCGAPLEAHQIVTYATGADGSRTAVCPLCGRHSVAASCPGDAYTVDAKFLACMHVCFFEPAYNEGKDESLLTAFENLIEQRAAHL